MKKTILIIIVIALSVVLSACRLEKVKFGGVRMMYGTNEAGRIAYDISTFTGIEQGEVQAETGQVILFSYLVDLDKGALFIEWQDPDGEVMWQKNIENSDQGEVDIEINSPGTHKILIRGSTSNI